MAERLTDAEIRELRRLDAAADPTPWEGMGGFVRVDAADSNPDVATVNREANEKLIVAIRNVLPRLLDELEEFRDG